MLEASNFWFTRLAFQRGLGLVYLIAFINVLNQFRPLLGEHGLLPVSDFVRAVPFRVTPSLFYLSPTDNAFMMAGWIGVIFSILTVTGISEQFNNLVSMSVWAVLWILYLSFVNVGQTFYGFGWESILLEAGFYAIFLGASRSATPVLMIWMLRWLLFRIMFGAGLIKMRGDPCWRNLTCLNYYYETQPIPNPLSWYFHWGPEWTKQGGVLFNHFAELVAPIGYFIPGRICTIAGLITIAFQCLIMVSGNLSFLNFLTLIIAIAALDDRCLSAILQHVASRPAQLTPSPVLHWSVIAVGILVVCLSINPIVNMVSRQQIMNTNFNSLHLVGTYGAFGSITRTRYEIAIEGTTDAAVTPATAWRDYIFKGKPEDPAQRPRQISPYHLRLDWLMWFAAMSNFEEHPWFERLMLKLLQGDRDVLSLFQANPFPNQAPRFVRAELYEYHFTTPAERRQTHAWWTRRLVGLYFPVVTLRNFGVQAAQ